VSLRDWASSWLSRASRSQTSCGSTHRSTRTLRIALAYFLAGGQAICPDGQVFGGEEDAVQKIIAFR